MAATPLKTALTRTNIHQAALITLLQNLVDSVNALIADHNTLRAKLNADAGVTDANYAASTANTVKLTKG
jgi:hypothetical protein